MIFDQVDAWFTDERLNYIGVTGVVLYLFAYFTLSRGWCTYATPWNRALRFIGLTGIIIPLYLRWYLSSSLLVAAGIMITVASIFALYIKRL